MAAKDQRPIVYLTSGIFGYLYRFFPIGRELIGRGHSLVVVSASSVACEHARAAGFDVRHLEMQEHELELLTPVAWPERWRPITSRLPGVALGPRTAARRYWQRRTSILADTSELEGLMSALDPKVVVTEAEEHRDIRACLAMGVDLLLFEDLYSTRVGPDVPFPARSLHVPTGTRRSRLIAAASWRRFFAVEAIRRKAEAWWVDGNDWHSMLESMAARAGLDGNAVSHRYFQYYDYLDLPRVRTTSSDLAFPGEPQPPSVVGPIVDPRRQVHDVDSDFGEQWGELLARREASGARLVFVSLGTFLSGLEHMTQVVIEATSSLPSTEIVLSVGKDRERWADADLPTNVSLFGRVPQTVVLAETDVVVSTGGLNTGHEALWFGAPVLNLPIAGLDTRGNAARLVFHGVGRLLAPRQISVEQVRDNVATLLDDPRYRARAQAIGERMRASNAASKAADVIEHRLVHT